MPGGEGDASRQKSTIAVERQTSCEHCMVPASPLVPPIVHTATYCVQSVQHFQQIVAEGGYAYIRLSNPTCEAAERAMNALEGGYGSIVFSSGMAAITTTLLTFLQPGDHMLYGCSHEFIRNYLRPRLNVEVTFVDGDTVDQYREAIRPNTKAGVRGEPKQPSTDGTRHGRVRAARCRTQNGDDDGRRCDIRQSTSAETDAVRRRHRHPHTKYIGGHEDLCAGVLTARTCDQWKELMHMRRLYGGVLSPHDASLLLRGLHTLALRVDRQSDSALKVANFLAKHPAVRNVHYPGLTTHPQHDVAAKQMDSKFGGVMSFVVCGGKTTAVNVVNSLRVFKLAVSLGGVTSLAEHPTSMTHGPFCMSDEDRRQMNLDPGLIRLSVGLESVDILIGDLQQSLEVCQSLYAIPDINDES